MKSYEQGQIYALNQIGLLYKNGQGVEKNITKAIEFFKQVSKFNNSDAFYYIGLCYFEGDENDINYTKAIKYFNKSAKLSNSMAIYQLGVCYYDGKGFERNFTKAIELFKESEKLGNTRAMHKLSLIYCFNDVVQQDYTKASEYYNKAISLGDMNSIKFVPIQLFIKNQPKIEKVIIIGMETLYIYQCMQNITDEIEYYKKNSNQSESSLILGQLFTYLENIHHLL